MDFFLPGMIHIDRRCGRYPAVSITGTTCSLGCSHCKGKLLDDMLVADSPERLIETLKMLENDGMKGALLSGGCDIQGRLPWKMFLPVLKEFKTSLFLSAHSGLNVDVETAKGMKDSGIRQALIDVTVDADAIRGVYHLNEPEVVARTIDNLYNYGPQVVPHIIAGINKGKIMGEFKALELLSGYGAALVIIVVLMPLNREYSSPPLEEVLEVFREAKRRFKSVGLGCARPRGKYRYMLEERLIEEGLVDRMAVWSDRALAKAEAGRHAINYHYTCCSVPIHEI